MNLSPGPVASLYGWIQLNVYVARTDKGHFVLIYAKRARIVCISGRICLSSSIFHESVSIASVSAISLAIFRALLATIKTSVGRTREKCSELADKKRNGILRGINFREMCVLRKAHSRVSHLPSRLLLPLACRSRGEHRSCSSCIISLFHQPLFSETISTWTIKSRVIAFARMIGRLIGRRKSQVGINWYESCVIFVLCMITWTTLERTRD